MYSNIKALTIFVASMFLVISSSALSAPPSAKGKQGGGGGGGGLSTVKKNNWDETHVRRVLRVFAYGGHASESQINTWSRMQSLKS